MSKRNAPISVSNLLTVSAAEAQGYLDASEGDELAAAHRLAADRNELEGTHREPDLLEVHHAFFMLRRAAGQPAPSPDQVRHEMKLRAA